MIIDIILKVFKFVEHEPSRKVQPKGGQTQKEQAHSDSTKSKSSRA